MSRTLRAAVFLSLLFPGLGQVYVGRYTKGLVLIGLTAGSCFLGLMVGLLVSILLELYALLDLSRYAALDV